jgi:bifunctional DNA primase/polymerase-like protein/primase-like protein
MVVMAERESWLNAALRYAERGLDVIPLHGVDERGACRCARPDCSSPGKHPLTSRGLKNASHDPLTLRDWWEVWADANVAVVTGVASGVIVLDVDGEPGTRTLGTLPSLPASWHSRTGRGEHYWFRHPGGVVPNAVRLRPGLDLRGDGGYVVVPPSRHATGRPYEWVVGPEDATLADPPPWLLELVRPTRQSEKTPSTQPPQVYEGARNETLYRLARSLKAKGLSVPAMSAALRAENETRCVPPLPPSEVDSIVQHAATQPDHVTFVAPALAPDVHRRENGNGTGGRGHSLPQIVITNRELRDLTEDGLESLQVANEPPTLFQRGGALTRLRCTEHGVPLLEVLTESAIRGLMARTADWRRSTDQGLVPVAPPMPVVKDVLALPEWRDIPILKAIIEAPTFGREGTLLTQPGYDPAGRLWFHASPGLTIPAVSECPSPENVREARELLLDELLGDFPFADEAARAHALAAMLLPFARELCGDRTPLHLIDAPTPGTGKGLLADMLTIPATGRSAEIMAEGRDDDEWRKRITAILIRAPGFILIDNVRRRLDSSALAAALTAGQWTDRVLGQSKTVTLPVRAVWLATGNNVGLSNEMARRSVWIRLDARRDTPWTRTDFRHPQLGVWALEHRGRLIHACLTLIQAWLSAGRPAGTATLGSFEAWATTMGGTLSVAGVPGFLGNAHALYAQADEEVQMWRAFVLAWWDKHHQDEVGTEELYALTTAETLLPEVLGDGGERSQRTKLGKALGRMRDRIIGPYRIVSEREDRKGRRLYRLESTGLPTSADVVPTLGDHVGAEEEQR